MAKKSPKRSGKAQESYIISLAMNEAEKRIKDGTASSQLLCHFLDLATEKKRLENKKLESDVKVAEAKIKQINQAIADGELYQQAIEAFQRYSGHSEDDDEE